MFSQIFELSISIRVGTLAMVSLPTFDPRPCLRWTDLNRLNQLSRNFNLGV